MTITRTADFFGFVTLKCFMEQTSSHDLQPEHRSGITANCLDIVVFPFRYLALLTKAFSFSQPVTKGRGVHSPHLYQKFAPIANSRIQCSGRKLSISRHFAKPLFSYLPFTINNELGGGQLFQSHGTESMELGGADADFSTQAELIAIAKTGGSIDQHR